MLPRDKIAKIKREPSFFNYSNLARTIKAAHQNKAAREKKRSQQQLNFVRFLIIFIDQELECDRQVCETFARLLLIKVWRHW